MCRAVPGLNRHLGFTDQPSGLDRRARIGRNQYGGVHADDDMRRIVPQRDRFDAAHRDAGDFDGIECPKVFDRGEVPSGRSQRGDRLATVRTLSRVRRPPP
jgi:hypothetical protein